MKNIIKYLIVAISFVCILFYIYAQISNGSIVNSYLNKIKNADQASHCSILLAGAYDNISEACSSKLFNYTLKNPEKGIQHINTLCNSNLLGSCEDLLWFNNASYSLQPLSTKTKTRNINNCIENFDTDCLEWLEISNVLGDTDLFIYLAGELVVWEYNQESKNKEKLRNDLNSLIDQGLISPSSLIEYWNELCEKSYDPNNSIAPNGSNSEKCKIVFNYIELHSKFKTKNFMEEFDVLKNDNSLVKRLSIEPSSKEIDRLCSSKQEEKLCSTFFNNQIVQIKILETSLTMTNNKVTDTSNIKLFMPYLKNEGLLFTPISIFLTEKYRLEKTKELEALAVEGMKDFQFNSKNLNEKKSELTNAYKFNSSYLTSLYSSINQIKNSPQINLNKLLFEPIDSLSNSVPERSQKYQCDKNLVKNCASIFKSIREARENKDLLIYFCNKGDSLSCELLRIEKKEFTSLPPGKILTYYKNNFKLEKNQSISSILLKTLKKNITIIMTLYLIILTLVVCFLLYSYISHIELINHLKENWKNDGNKKANAILSKLKKNNGNDKDLE